jgi:hypothetical protein
MLINIIAAIGWISLIALSPFWKSADKFLIGIIVCLLAFVYSYLNFTHIGESGGPAGFSTFEGVSKIFSNPWLIDAAWAHIIAFDLVVAMLIRNNAAKHGIHYGIVVVVLLITIVFAPLGLLVYLLVRWIKTKSFFTSLS